MTAPPDPTPIAATGSVWIDIRGVDLDNAYRRFFSLGNTPAGAKIFVLVGALIVDPRSMDLMRQERHRLHFEFLGQPFAVGRWVRALNADDPWTIDGGFMDAWT